MEKMKGDGADEDDGVEGGEWETVKRRKWSGVDSIKKKTTKDYSPDQVVITFFFTDFPENWKKPSLWNVFARYGVIANLYVARKKGNNGKLFGFVRFIKDEDVDLMEARLKDITIEGCKLSINVARFQKNVVTKENTNSRMYPLDHKPMKKVHDEMDSEERKHSYAGVVSGSKYDASSSNICLHSLSDRRLQLGKLLIGEAKTFHILTNIRSFCNMEGLSGLTFRYLGGLRVGLEFNCKEETEDVLLNKSECWRKWFNKVYPWSDKYVYENRLAWLNIEGIPPQVWCSESFSRVAESWGSVVIPEDCATGNEQMAFGRVCILTNLMEPINEMKKIVVDGCQKVIRVVEDMKVFVPFSNPIKMDGEESKGEPTDGIRMETGMLNENLDLIGNEGGFLNRNKVSGKSSIDSDGPTIPNGPKVVPVAVNGSNAPLSDISFSNTAFPERFVVSQGIQNSNSQIKIDLPCVLDNGKHLIVGFGPHEPNGSHGLRVTTNKDQKQVMLHSLDHPKSVGHGNNLLVRPEVDQQIGLEKKVLEYKGHDGSFMRCRNKKRKKKKKLRSKNLIQKRDLKYKHYRDRLKWCIRFELENSLGDTTYYDEDSSDYDSDDG